MEKLDLSDEEKKNKEFKLNPIWPSPPKKRKSALKALSKIKQAVSDLKRHSGLTPKKRRKNATKNIKKNSPQEVLFPRVNPGRKKKKEVTPRKN
jgi:phage terminase small subunit